jgi:hypothetical protein
VQGGEAVKPRNGKNLAALRDLHPRDLAMLRLGEASIAVGRIINAGMDNPESNDPEYRAAMNRQLQAMGVAFQADTDLKGAH